MLRVNSAVSGEELAALSTEEASGKCVKFLKALLAKQVGVPRFRQRWFSEDGSELRDDAIMTPCTCCAQIVNLECWPPADGQIQVLSAACEENRPEEVEVLLQQPLHPDVLNEAEVLQDAAMAGNWECVSLLLEANAAPDGRHPPFYTPLHLGARSGHIEIVRLLLDSRAAVGKLNRECGMTALHEAAGNGHCEVVQALLEARADKDSVTLDRGETACHLAAAGGHSEVVRLFLVAGIDVNVLQDDDVVAAWLDPRYHHSYQHLELLHRLVDLGASIGKAHNDEIVSVYLDLAVGSGHLQDLRLLLQAGVGAEASESENLALPMAQRVASEHGFLEVAQVLAQEGSEIGNIEVDETMLLHLTSTDDRADSVQLRLRPLSQKDTSRTHGTTCLHRAAEEGYLEVLRLLLEARANQDMLTMNQETPLQLATRKGHGQVAQALLRREMQQARLTSPRVSLQVSLSLVSLLAAAVAALLTQ